MAVENAPDPESLFTLWRTAQAAESQADYQAYGAPAAVPKDFFLPDGILAPDAWAAAAPRILFVAKEAFWFNPQVPADPRTPAPFWLQQVVEERLAAGGGGSNFSRRLALLAKAALAQAGTAAEDPYRVLARTAFLNLNKRGGFRSCVWRTLEGYVSRYRAFIRREIELIAPDWIIACGYGTAWLLEAYACVPPEVRRVISVYHPGCRLSDRDYLEQLDCAIRGLPWTPPRRRSA